MGLLPDGQDRVFDYLLDPGTYGLPPGESVVRIDTHISAVFLAGKRAYKVQKAVVFKFLDHSRLDTREGVCRGELAVNGPWAEGLYLDVIAVTERPNGRLSLGGKGRPVEWVLVMRRFDQDALLSQIVERSRPPRAQINDLAELLVHFHANAPIVEGRETWASDTLAGILLSLAPYRDFLGEAACDGLADGLIAALQTALPLLTRRARSGFVRRGHGDLHLNNIVLWRGRLVPFDAIDFNDVFVEIDVLYDLAFLLMDLDARGHRQLASYVLNHTLEFTGDVGGLALLPLFLALRSTIRAFTGAATAYVSEKPDEQAAKLDDARTYLKRAQDYLQRAPARLIAVGGLSGSGKSRLARKLAGRLPGGLGAVVLRTDVVRKRLMGVGPYEVLPPQAYTPDLGARTYQALLDEGKEALSMGVSVILDGVFARPEERAAAEDLARSAGLPFDGLWAQARRDVAVERIKHRRRNASDATEAVRLHQETYDVGEIDWTVIESSGSRKKTLCAALDALGLTPGRSSRARLEDEA